MTDDPRQEIKRLVDEAMPIGMDELDAAFTQSGPGEEPAPSEDGGGGPPKPKAWGYDVPKLNREWALVLMGSKAVIVHEQDTAGTTAAQALAASSRRFLAIDNESTTATISCTFGTTLTAGINAAGSFTIPPGNTRTWGNTFVPAAAVWCVASAAATPVTIQAN